MNTVLDTHLPPVGQLAGTHDAPTQIAGTHDAQPFQASCTAVPSSMPQVWWLRQEPDGRFRVLDLATLFHELADRWEDETVFLSSSAQMAAHPDYKAIVSLGMPAVPLILKRMQLQGGYWHRVLRDITKVNPVDPTEHGNVAAIQKAWLRWGRDNGSI